jgi:hypothetical protein
MHASTKKPSTGAVWLYRQAAYITDGTNFCQRKNRIYHTFANEIIAYLELLPMKQYASIKEVQYGTNSP